MTGLLRLKKYEKRKDYGLALIVSYLMKQRQSFGNKLLQLDALAFSDGYVNVIFVLT